MPRKKISNVHKATAGAGLVGVASAYAAAWASQKFAIPLEVTSIAAGSIIGYVARLAAKMLPDV